MTTVHHKLEFVDSDRSLGDCFIALTDYFEYAAKKISKNNICGQGMRAISYNVVWFWPVTSSHTLGINKLSTNFGLRMRIDTSQSFWKAVNHVFEAEYLLY